VTFYRRNLPHLQRDYKPHFITFVTKFRQVLPGWARDITFGCCLHDHGIRYSLHVAVVMPNHVHLILTPLTDQKRRLIVSLIEIMRAIKGASARAINQRLRLHGAVWQDESFDHVLRSSENLDAKDRLHSPKPCASRASARLASISLGVAEAAGKSLCSTGEPPGITNHVALRCQASRIECGRTNASAATHSDHVPTRVPALNELLPRSAGHDPFVDPFIMAAGQINWNRVELRREYERRKHSSGG